MFIDIHTHNTKIGIEQKSIYSVCLPDTMPIVPNMLYSAGQHPWNMDNDYTDMLFDIESKIIAIGEIGLDRLYPDYSKQQSIFERQLQIAIELNKPVIIHSVKSFDDTFLMLNKYKNKLNGAVIHSFIGDISQANKYISIGCYLSFSPLSFRSAKSVRALERIEPNYIFLESDNIEIDIKTQYDKCATILGYEIGVLENIIEENYKKINLK